MAVVQFEKRFVSGHAFRHAAKNSRVPGFSRCAATGKPRRLKPFTLVALVASLKRCPDTNLFSNCTITRSSTVPAGSRTLPGGRQCTRKWPRLADGESRH